MITSSFSNKMHKIFIYLYNCDFDSFSKHLSYAIGVDSVHEDYAIEKFKIMRNGICEFVFGNLDDETRLRFLNSILNELKEKGEINE